MPKLTGSRIVENWTTFESPGRMFFIQHKIFQHCRSASTFLLFLTLILILSTLHANLDLKVLLLCGGFSQLLFHAELS
jgi:hypothetical protein